MNETAKLIAILFYSSEPISLNSLSKNLALDKEKLTNLINKANEKISELGLVIISDSSTVQLVAQPEYSRIIDEFYDSTPQSLSQPALETLSVIAYKQPISKEEIDEIRGVASEQSIKNLINKHLIKKVSENNNEKYKTTTDFLKLMGIESVSQLEDYNENK